MQEPQKTKWQPQTTPAHHRARQALLDLTLSGVMAALSMVMCRFLGFPHTGSWRIDPGFLPIVMVAFLSGPVWAGMSYGVADLVGAAIFTGINPFITMEKILIGVIFGIGFYRRERLGTPRILVTHLAAAVICDYFIMTLIFTYSFGMPMRAAMATRALNAGVNFAMRSLMCMLLDIKLFAAVRRRGGAYFGSL